MLRLLFVPLALTDNLMSTAAFDDDVWEDWDTEHVLLIGFGKEAEHLDRMCALWLQLTALGKQFPSEGNVESA